MKRIFALLSSLNPLVWLSELLAPRERHYDTEEYRDTDEAEGMLGGLGRSDQEFRHSRDSVSKSPVGRKVQALCDSSGAGDELFDLLTQQKHE